MYHNVLYVCKLIRTVISWSAPHSHSHSPYSNMELVRVESGKSPSLTYNY
jgi:hypothetical protein